MKARKIILIQVLFAFTCITLAQPPKNQKEPLQGPPPIPSSEQITKMVDHLAKEISLSKEQKETILDLHLQHFKEIKAKMCADNPPVRKEMEALRREFEKDIKSILSAEQQRDFDQFMEHLHKQQPKK